jgi:hypothetical protein
MSYGGNTFPHSGTDAEKPFGRCSGSTGSFARDMTDLGKQNYGDFHA